MPIKDKWTKRIMGTNPNKGPIIMTSVEGLHHRAGYGWWDVARLNNNLQLIERENVPIVHVDMDVIVLKDLTPLVELDSDIIISREPQGEKAFPQECSKILGFGVCTGFYIIKPSASAFMRKIYDMMYNKKYGSLSDQVTIMNYIVNSQYTLEDVNFGTIIHIDNIKIYVLHKTIIVRDPMKDIGQYANHINIDNVGGTSNFLKYFDYPLDVLPKTCRCGKFGDKTICKCNS